MHFDIYQSHHQLQDALDIGFATQLLFHIAKPMSSVALSMLPSRCLMRPAADMTLLYVETHNMDKCLYFQADV